MVQRAIYLCADKAGIRQIRTARGIIVFELDEVPLLHFSFFLYINIVYHLNAGMG